MILLFLSVWAIVIALNEVLFAAQPFSMTSIAAAMPHTLMFSVVLSAAVYIAKKRIIDAVHKGRTIDKRFVAELTPEVGHQLNTMRRKLEAMDGDSTPGNKVKGKQKGRHFPSDSELAKANKDKNRRNKEKFDRLHENAQASLRSEQLRKQKEEATAQARSKAVKQATREDLFEQRTHSASAEKHNDHSLVVGDPNDFVKEAHAQMMEQAQSRIEAAQRKRKEHELEVQRQNAPSLDENRARLAKEKELQKERREAQIKALGALSQEEKAAEDARRAYEAQMRAQEQEKAAAAARAEALARAEAAARAEAEAKAKAREMAKARAEAEARDKMEAEQRAMAKVRELAAAKARASAAAKAREHEMRMKIEQEAKLKAAQEEKARKAAVARSQQKLQEEALKKASKVEVAVSNKASHQMELEIANEQHKKKHNIELPAAEKKPETGGIDYVDQIEIPKGGLDTSSLKPYQMPKRGAGLDTSALKKAKLSRGAKGAVTPAISKLASSRATLSNATLTKSGMTNKTNVSHQTQSKAMSAVLNNDTNLERGDVQTLELSNYQANARARALSRAQSNKASAQAMAQANANNKVHAQNTADNELTKHNGSSLGSANRRSAGAQASSHGQSHGMGAAHGASHGAAKAMDQAQARGQAQANAKNALGAKGPIGIGTTVAGMPHNYIGSQNAPVRQVVTTSNKVQARPQGDNLPKTAPSNPLSNIQTAPIIKARGSVAAQNRDNLFAGAVNDPSGAPVGTTMNAPMAQVVNTPMDIPEGDSSSAPSKTDLIHAQANANAYMKMQTQTAPLTRKNKHNRTRPSQMLQSNEVV